MYIFRATKNVKSCRESYVMKICVIAPYDALSPAFGASVRVFKIAMGLSICGANVFVLHHGLTKVVSSNLRFVNFKSFDLVLGSTNYLHPLNPFYPSKLSSFLEKINPDIVQGEQPWSAFPTIFFTRRYGVPYILDAHNVEFLWSIYASKMPLLAPFTFLVEKLATKTSSSILTISEVDRDHLSRIYKIPTEKFFMVPNGIDVSRFDEKPSSLNLKKRLGFSSESKIVVFHGSMGTRQNYEASNLIVDYIAPKIRSATFLIIGKNPPLWLRKKAKAQKNVLLLGFVPKVEEYIMAADVCIAPIRRGSGTRLKLLEYLAAGKPIVSTIIGAEGLPLKSNVHGILCKDIDECFIGSIKNLLLNKGIAKEMCKAARMMAEKFDWKIITEQLFEFYKEELLGKASV